jgi:hypothetical protein
MSLDSLIVYESKYPKIRIGEEDRDGGYVIADISGYDLLLSCGISNDVSFEKDFLSRYPVKAYGFDGTIEGLPEPVNNLEFVKLNIGPRDTDLTTNMHTLINSHNNIFLKMDIESYEFRWLHSLSTDQMKKFKQITMEIHFPFTENDIAHFDVPLPVNTKMSVLDKLAYTHRLIHFHGNNYCETTIYSDVNVPNIFECTYVRKDDHEFCGYNTVPVPHPLDRPNIPSMPEFYFSGYPYTGGPRSV